MMRNILDSLLQPLNWNILNLLVKLLNRNIVDLMFNLNIISMFLLYWNIFYFGFRYPLNVFLVNWDVLAPGLFSWFIHILLMLMLMMMMMLKWRLVRLVPG